MLTAGAELQKSSKSVSFFFSHPPLHTFPCEDFSRRLFLSLPLSIPLFRLSSQSFSTPPPSPLRSACLLVGSGIRGNSREGFSLLFRLSALPFKTAGCQRERCRVHGQTHVTIRYNKNFGVNMQVQEALFHPTAHSMGSAGATGFLPFAYLAARLYVFSRCLTVKLKNFT